MIDFNLTLVNLTLKDATDDKNSFRVVLGPE